MSYYVRKITQSKWDFATDVNDICKYPADAVTSELKTSKNKLSLWKIDDKSEMDDIILALSTSSSTLRIETINVTCLDESVLHHNNLSLEWSDGDTAVSELKSKHVDIVGLSYQSIGVVAKIIATSLRDGYNVRYKASKVKEILRDAKKSNKIDMDKVNDKLRAEIDKL